VGMAWRIDTAVVRGELDNRVRGHVTGLIWLAGREEPLALGLEGNCWRDLAGRRLEFVNPSPQASDLQALDEIQAGVAGDITASRKVKVPDIPLDQIGAYYEAKKPFPWHWGNALYLEWFSALNGRIVIETTAFELRIVGEPAWEMSADEETAQREANAASLAVFMEDLTGPAEDDGATYEDTAWNEDAQTEEEAEQMQARSELLADRIQARLTREGAEADYEKIMVEEIARLSRELGEPEPTPEDLARNATLIEEANRAAEESLELPDPDLDEELANLHPVAEQARELTLLLMDVAEDHGWIPEQATDEHPAADMVNTVMKAGVKLAGALNGQVWPPPREFCAGIIVRLKKARVYLDDALRATESCHEEKLIPPAQMGPILVQIIDLEKDVDAIIDELRERLKGRIE
jgi:hypothetical protein